MQRIFYIYQNFIYNKPLHTEYLHTKYLYIYIKYFHIQEYLYKEFFTYREIFIYKTFYIQQIFTEKRFYTKIFFVYNNNANYSSKTGWISVPKQKKYDFEVFFKRNFKRRITSAKIEKICWQIIVVTLVQSFQYYLWNPIAKKIIYSRGTKQPWRSHYNMICRYCIAKHNVIPHSGVGNCNSKTGSRKKKKILKRCLKGLRKGNC